MTRKYTNRRANLRLVKVGTWWKSRRGGAAPRQIARLEQDGLVTKVAFGNGGRVIPVACLIAQYDPCAAPEVPKAKAAPPERPVMDELVEKLVAALAPEIRKMVRQGIDDAFSAGDREAAE